eukprot:1453241-Prymnesium_polylepis.1
MSVPSREMATSASAAAPASASYGDRRVEASASFAPARWRRPSVRGVSLPYNAPISATSPKVGAEPGATLLLPLAWCGAITCCTDGGGGIVRSGSERGGGDGRGGGFGGGAGRGGRVGTAGDGGGGGGDGGSGGGPGGSGVHSTVGGSLALSSHATCIFIAKPGISSAASEDEGSAAAAGMPRENSHCALEPTRRQGCASWTELAPHDVSSLACSGAQRAGQASASLAPGR